MSGLAELLRHFGHAVTGSDRTPSPATARLETLGVKLQYGHSPDLITSAGIVIYSSAIREENPERLYAREHGLTLLRRAEALGQIMRGYSCACVAGTHGKTTTTSLLGMMLTEANMRPTVLVGGTLVREGSPLIIGESGIMVAEADEYDRSFLAMFPALAVITNIEADHLDCYANLDDIKQAFVQFAARVPFYGAVICCADDPGVRSVLPLLGPNRITYGAGKTAEYTARAIEFADGRASFDVVRRDETLGRVSLSIPGMHNVVNALGALAAAVEMGAPFSAIRSALSKFAGVKRRFEVVGKERNITVIDDYAHHPGEIAATLAAARRSDFQRITAVFQPHLFSRTRDFMDDFAASLAKADTVVVTDIYKSREEPIAGITAATIVKKLRELGHADAHYVARKEEIVKSLAGRIASGDAVVVMGAGDIGETARELAEALRNG